MHAPKRAVPVRLTRKYADVIDGVNLSGRRVGDRLCLERSEAQLLIAEGWAERVPDEERRRPDALQHDTAADREDHERCA